MSGANWQHRLVVEKPFDALRNPMNHDEEAQSNGIEQADGSESIAVQRAFRDFGILKQALRVLQREFQVSYGRAFRL